jgi:malate synthase
MPKSKKQLSNGKTQSPRATIRSLREQVKQLKLERDRYQAALTKFLPKRKSPWTKKDLRDMEEFRPTFSEFVQQLREQLRTSK